MSKRSLHQIQHSKRAHAPLAPSALKRTMECPGSFVACEGIETTTSDAALEGIKAHEWVERLRKACMDDDPNKYANELLILENQDEEMAFHCDSYIDFLDTLKENFHSEKFDEYEEYLEKRLRFTDNIWGTLDYACVRRKIKGKWQAIIVDLKYGRGVYVPVKDNVQLIAYLICLETYLSIRFEKAWIYIYQPRIPKEKPFEVLKLTWDDITIWRKKILKGEELCLDMKAGKVPLKYNAGDHCQFCPAKAVPWPDGSAGCPTFKRFTEVQGIKLLDDAHLPVIENAPIAALVELHKKKKAIEHFLQDVDHYLLMRGLRKDDIGDLKIVEGQARRKWKDDPFEVAHGLQELGVQPWTKKLITIGAVEKKIGKNKINHLTVKPPGKLQLAAPEDERPKAELGKSAIALLD